jgi:hypothetical protein
VSAWLCGGCCASSQHRASHQTGRARLPSLCCECPRSHEAAGALLQRHLHAVSRDKGPGRHGRVLHAEFVNVLQAPAARSVRSRVVTCAGSGAFRLAAAQAHTPPPPTHLPGSRDLRFWASVTHLYCTLHTLSTSGTRRLNSSKQPQLPLAAVTEHATTPWHGSTRGQARALRSSTDRQRAGGAIAAASHPGP